MTSTSDRLFEAALVAFEEPVSSSRADAVVVISHVDQVHALAALMGTTGPSLVVTGDGLAAALVIGRPATWLRRQLTSSLDRPAAVSTPIRASHELRRGLRSALLALHQLTSQRDGQVVLVAEHLPEIMAWQAPDALALLVRRLAEPVLRQGSDATELLDTAYWFLRLDSSVAETARIMATHRNTVRNRIDRLSTLTGVGLDGHRDRVLWSLALLAIGRHDVLQPASRLAGEAAA